MTQISINQVEYSTTRDGALIHIFGREDSGTIRHLTVSGFRPYFYIAEGQRNEQHPQMMVIEDKNYMSIHGEPVARAYTFLPSDVPNIRDRYKHYEADVVFTTRFLVDNNLTGGVEAPSETCKYQDLNPVRVDSPPRVCMLDIECDSYRKFPTSDRDPIIAITCWDSYTGEYTSYLLTPTKTPVDMSKCVPTKGGCFSNSHTLFQYSDEKSLLIAFAAYIKNTDPDILSGWNSTAFDIPYIKGRMNALGISTSLIARLPGESEKIPIRGRSTFDLLTGYKKLQDTQKESYRLDAIAEEELGDKKVRYTGTINTLWRTQPDKLVEYNFKDVELCVGINDENDIINFYVEVSRFVGCSLESTVVSSTIIDVYILRRAHGKYVLPSKGHAMGKTFEGAIVFSPSLGMKENVVVLDLKALYPMCMMTMNASPETKDPSGKCHSPNGIRFKCKPDGLTRAIVAELMAERDRKKDEMKKCEVGSNEYRILNMQQGVLKIIMNTYYGVSGYNRFRLYDPDIASAVTSAGREILEYTREIIEKEGYTVIYGDTDSNMVQFPPDLSVDEIIALARKIEKKLNDSYPAFAKEKMNSDECYFSIKFEKIFRRFFQAGKKKRYAGHLIWKEGKVVDEINVTGFEIRRSDYPQITKDAQKTVLDLLLRGGSIEDMRKYLGKIITDYRKGSYSLDMIGIPGGIQKDISSYEHDDAHLRGAKYSNMYLGSEFGSGSKPKRIYIITVTSKYPQTDVICFEYGDQVPKEFVVDYETMVDKTIRKPVMRLLEPLGLEWSQIDPEVKTLADFT